MYATMLLALAAIVAGCRPVRIPRLRIDMVPIHPFLLLALALEGGGAAVIVGLTGVLGAAAARTPPPKMLRLAFNLVTTAMAAWAASWVAYRLGGRVDAPASTWTWPLAGATVTYFFASTGLVATAIAIEKREGFFATWNRSLRWTALPYFAGFTIAIAALVVCETSIAAGLALTIAPCWCLVLAYRSEARKHLPVDQHPAPQGDAPPAARGTVPFRR